MTDTHTESPSRPPKNIFEAVMANLRPQPAIPGLLVLFLTVAIPVLSQGPVQGPLTESSWLTLLVPVGILSSCALAIAAGCCSFFPQISWIAVALWAIEFTGNGVLPAYNRWVLIAGMFAAVVSIGVQFWRVVTGRFIPTIRLEEPDSDYPD